MVLSYKINHFSKVNIIQLHYLDFFLIARQDLETRYAGFVKANHFIPDPKANQQTQYVH